MGVLAYADVIVLLGEDEKSLIELPERMLVTEKRVGLEINYDKNEYVILQRRETESHAHIWK